MIRSGRQAPRGNRVAILRATLIAAPRMAKTIFQHGTPVTPDWLNSINNPVFDGQDLDGHRPPLSDAELDSSPDSVKSRVETLADWLKVEHTSGLGVQWTAGVLRLANGTTLPIPGNVATLPDNATTYFYVRNGGTTVERGAGIPANALRLAIVITADGAVTSITDLRASLFTPFDTLHGALSEQTQDLRDRLDTLAAATVDQIESLSAQVDSLESSQGDALGGLTANLTGATAGDVIVVGAGGTSLTRIPQTSLSTANASGINGYPVSLLGANPGDILTIGTGGNIVSTKNNSNSVAGVPFNLNGLDPGELLGYNGTEIVPVGGNSYINLGTIGSTTPAFVASNRSYMFNSLGSSARVVIPAPSKISDALTLVNYGTDPITLDFATNAVGTDTGNAVMGSMAAVDMLSVGSTTKDWFYFPSPTSPQGRVAGMSGGSGSIGGSTNGLWAEVQSAWGAISSTVTGGGTRTISGSTPNLHRLMVVDETYSVGYGVTYTPLDAWNGGVVSEETRLWSMQGEFYKIDNSTLLMTPISGLPQLYGWSLYDGNISSGFTNVNFSGCVLSDGRCVLGVNSNLYLYNPKTGTLSLIGNAGRQIGVSTIRAFGMKVIIFSASSNTLVIDEYDASSNTWASRVTSSTVGVSMPGLYHADLTGNHIIFAPDNKFWISSGTGVAKYDPQTGSLSSVSAPIVNSGSPHFLGITQSGRVLYSDAKIGSTALFSILPDLTERVTMNLTQPILAGFPCPLPDGRAITSTSGTLRTLILSGGQTQTTESSNYFASQQRLGPPNVATFTAINRLMALPGGKYIQVGQGSNSRIDLSYSHYLPASILCSPFFSYF